MQRTIKNILCVVGLTLLALPLPAADDAEGARLRETLRATVMQLRNAQSDLAAAQSAQSGLAEEKKNLGEQIALLKKHTAEDQATAEKKVTEQQARLRELTEQVARLAQANDELKAELGRQSQLAKDTEGKRLQAYNQSILLERQLAELRARNMALYRLGKDILNRYEKVGLGQQFLAREPFVGRTRVALENQIQDFDDKLSEQRASNP